MFIVALFIIAKTWKQTKVSFNRWMDKQTVVHPYNGILFNDKKKCAIQRQKDMEEP